MKIVVIADVHGNLSSLKRLEQEDDFKTADKVYALGDIVVDYSRPNECIKWVCENALPCKGNNDAFVCSHIPTRGMESFKMRKIKQITFMHDQITKENRDIVNAWPKYRELVVDGVKFIFCHYFWDQDDDVVVDGGEKSFEGRSNLFKELDADYIFFGHEHDSNNFTDGVKHFYCTSSLGLKNPSRYYVINIENGNVDVKENCYLHDFDIENRMEYELIKANSDFFK